MKGSVKVVLFTGDSPMEIFVDLPVPGINTAVADHFIMLFRDMADQTLDNSITGMVSSTYLLSS